MRTKFFLSDWHSTEEKQIKQLPRALLTERVSFSILFSVQRFLSVKDIRRHSISINFVQIGSELQPFLGIITTLQVKILQ